MDKRQKLLVKYHPVPILDYHFKQDDSNESLENMKDEQIQHILEENDEDKILDLDQKLIEQMIGNNMSL